MNVHFIFKIYRIYLSKHGPLVLSFNTLCSSLGVRQSLTGSLVISIVYSPCFSPTLARLRSTMTHSGWSHSDSSHSELFSFVFIAWKEDFRRRLTRVDVSGWPVWGDREGHVLDCLSSPATASDVSMRQRPAKWLYRFFVFYALRFILFYD